MADRWNEMLQRSIRDLMIPATVMMLKAEQLGYGTAFTGVFSADSDWKRKLSLPPKALPVVVLSIGRPMDIRQTQRAVGESSYLDFDCKGELQKANRYTVIERDESGTPVVVTRSVDIGPKVRNSNLNYLLTY